MRRPEPPPRVPLLSRLFAALTARFDALDAALATVLTRQTRHSAQNKRIMATQQELAGELTQIKTAVDEVKVTAAAQVAEIAALKAQIAAGSPVTQEQLDALDAQADEILAVLGGAPPVEGTPV